MLSVRRSLPIPLVGILALTLVGALPASARSQTTTSQAPATTKAPSRTSLARAAAAARARRAAEARLRQEALLSPRYKLDLEGNTVPDIRAAAAIIYNPQSGEVLWEANSHTQRSIASLT